MKELLSKRLLFIIKALQKTNVKIGANKQEFPRQFLKRYFMTQIFTNLVLV